MEISSHLPVFLFDGAFGTYYNALTSTSDYCERANLINPSMVQHIHQKYLDAGATAIKTNTFGANSLLFDEDEKAQIIISGYQLALKATEGTSATVFADIGYINSDEATLSDEYLSISQTFIDCGAKYFLFETFAEYSVILPAIEYIKTKLPDAYIIVSFAVSQDGYTKKGHYYKDLIALATLNPSIDIVGLNCICGPSHLCNLIQKLDAHKLNLSAMPNAGYPSTVNGRIVYQDNAEYFSEKLLSLFNLGTKVIGGCCGTTPEHIKLTAKKLNASSNLSPSNPSLDLAPETINASPSYLEKLFESDRKIIAVELDPPLDTDCTHIMSAAKELKLAGADIITIADSPLARTRADSMMMAAKIKREVGIDVIPHLSCRDKNHIGIKGSLLAAHIEGVQNILAITGDPVAQTDRGHCKGVFNLNSYNLISFIQSLNAEVFSHAPYFVGGALNVNASQFESELKRAKRKEENGASFFLTQPLFSDESIENLHTSYQELNGKLLAGILPFASYRNALFLNNEVSGITIPDTILNSLKDKTPEEVLPISIKFSSNLVRKCFDSCDGFYLMTPLKKTELICNLIKNIRAIEKELE